MSMLYIVATPIGNLKDITLRAIETLKGVDLILAEDTRVTKKLLTHYDIRKRLESFHQHSTPQKISRIIEMLSEGKDIALVSDAGTPGINDPGGILIKKLLTSDVGNLKTSDVKIIPIPGPNAVITALSISGINADKFLFLGYPPHKKGRQTFFKEVANSKYPVVFYESTHRITKALKQLSELKETKERQLVIARELTKKFETIYRGTALEILPQLEKEQRGEFVVIVEKNK